MGLAALEIGARVVCGAAECRCRYHFFEVGNIHPEAVFAYVGGNFGKIVCGQHLQIRAAVGILYLHARAVGGERYLYVLELLYKVCKISAWHAGLALFVYLRLHLFDYGKFAVGGGENEFIVFSGYFDDIVYDDEHGYWINPKLHIQFVHDHENDKHVFIERFQRRIKNLFDVMQDDKPCLFVCHVLGDAHPQKVNELYEFLAQRCKHKKFKLVVAVFNGTLGKCNENVKVYAKNFPYKDYSYMDKKIKFTKDGYDFEYTFVACCREELLKLLED